MAGSGPHRGMESSRGRPRPGPQADLLAVAEQQAARLGGRPTRTSSSAPSGSRDEAESVGVASRRSRASPKAPGRGGSTVPGPERAAGGEDQPRSGPRSRRAGSEAGPGDPEAGAEVCRRGSPGGAAMSAELAPREEDRDPERDEAEAAGGAGRSFSSRLQDSRSLDGLSGAAAGAAEPGAGGGRRATISSPLELEGTVSRHGDLTHFVANNLQLKIRLSGAPAALPPAPARPCPTPAPTIPPIDPDVLRDLERLSRELGGRVDRLLRGLGGAVQELTALSVGCIQTYRDAVDSLGEAVDMSIKGMYTLLARCEELERALQPVQGLARQVRDIRRTLEVLEALCK